MSTMISLDMNLPIPVVSVELGPDWALDINACLTLIDSHDHTSGKGVPVTPNGININSDFPFNGNDAISVRTVNFSVQSSTLTDPTDIGCLYVSGVDLYYNDESGNIIRMTSSGNVNAGAGSITGMTSPASATYVSGSQTFIWQSAVNTPANNDGGSLILRNIVANSKGLTLSPPNAMGSDYSLILPALPGVTNIMSLDASGNIAAVINVDNSTIQLSSNTLAVKDGGITEAKVVSGFGFTPAGAILAFGGTSAPSGYLLCDGTSYLRATYPNLFTAIGTAFGTADGTHFNVPDLRGRFERGVDGTTNRDPDKSSRTAMNTGGNTGNSVGSIQTAAFASHTHTYPITDNASAGSAIITSVPGQNTLTTLPTSASGGNETRPINAYVNYIIKT